MPTAEAWSLKARWVFPVETPPVENGTVTIQDEKIVAVTSSPQRSADHDLGDAAVLPGLVNAHTHLDLTGLRGHIPTATDFTHWLRAVVRHRRGLTVDEVWAAIRAGLAESLAFGTTLLGDISAQGLSWPILSAAPLWSVVFYELLGLPRPRARQALAEARTWLQAHAPTATCFPGLSPHAPYSVRASLYRAIAGLARRYRVAVATHLAESPAELQLLGERQGPFVSFLSELGAWDAEGLVHDIDSLRALYADLCSVLWVHGNYLSADMLLGQRGTVVYCPRTHAAFGHAPHPFREFLAKGVRVALGTDSLASNPDLDILAEARFVRRLHPDLPGSVLLRMATLAGAEALGCDRETGSLVPGKSADLIVLPLDKTVAHDPHDLILESCTRVRAALWRGRWINSPT
jgi:cytosine/adenosine deaminase-related metal-dependent hydrolase